MSSPRTTESSSTLVESGDVDVSFVVFPLVPGPFEAVELMRDPYVLLTPSNSPLARRGRPPTLREIVELPLISYRSCRTTQQVEERLRVTGRDPHVVFRSDDNETVQGLVAAGVGVALVPQLTVDAKRRAHRRSSGWETGCRHG